MAISFEKVSVLLAQNGKTFYNLKKDNIVGMATIAKLQHNYGHIDTRTLNNLCAYLHCQPGDILEYVPDPESLPENE